MQLMADLPAKEHARLWINHDKRSAVGPGSTQITQLQHRASKHQT
jgi:hypothetical protein